MDFPASILRRYRPVRELGRGGGGVVYLVEDSTDPGRPRALKLVRRRGDRTRKDLLRKEFDLLRGLRHPGLVPVLDFGMDSRAGFVWFTSEYTSGPDIYQASADWSPQDLHAALATLAETLGFLHRQGLAHNDVKPSNTRVPADPASVRLLDFGLASARGAKKHIGGTLSFMSPERLRRPEDVGPAADLWSLGVVAYACATRRFPFPGDDRRTLLGAIRGGMAAPRALRPTLSPALEKVILRLLEPDPAARYARTDEVLRDLEQVRPRGVSVGPPPSLPTPPLLARGSLLEEVRAAWARARRGIGPERILLVGEPGLGKSHLLEVAKQEIQLDGGGVVAVRAHRGSPRAWALVAEMTRRLDALPGKPRAPEPLAHLAGLTGLRERRTGSTVGEAFLEYATACAEAAPLALMVDDLGWGDAASLSALFDLARRPVRDLPLLLLASSRDEPESAGPLSTWRAAGWPVLPLAPLPDDVLRALLAWLLPDADLPETLVADAVAGAAGNPLALEESARAWVDAGAVGHEDGRWRAIPGVAVPTAGAPLQLLTSRLRALPAPLREVVGLVAVHGRPLAPAVLERTIPESGAGMATLCEMRLLAATDDGIDVRHPLVRQAALEGAAVVDQERRLALARALEAHGAPPRDLWEHFLRGGDRTKGLRLALEAGRHAKEVEDYGTARIILEETRDAVRTDPSGLGESDHAALREWLAACLVQTGAPAAAVELLDEVLASAPNRTDPRLRLAMAQALKRSGEYDRADAVLRELQASTGDSAVILEAGVDRWAILRLGRFAEAADLIASLVPTARSLESDPSAAVLLARFHQVAALTEEMAHGPGAGASHFDDALRLARQSEIPGLVAVTSSARAAALMLAGRIPECLAQFVEVEQLLRRGGSSERWQVFCRYRGYALHHRGDDAAALDQLGKALSATGSVERVWHTLGLLADVLADLGDPAALDRATEVVSYMREGKRSEWLETALAAGLRAAVWLGRRDGTTEMTDALTVLDEAQVAPTDVASFATARAMAALLSGDAEAAARQQEEACKSAARFQPLLSARCLFTLAWIEASRGRSAEACDAATRAAAAFRALGNDVEAARARALIEAVDEERVTRPLPAGRWLERLATLDAATACPELAERLVRAAAAAAGATGAWLVFGRSADRRIEARAGACGAADPLAWTAAIESCFASRGPVERAGMGVALPVEISGEPAVLVVEDRAFPQAFAPEAVTAVRLAVGRVVDHLRRSELEEDVRTLRVEVDRTSRSGSTRPRTTASTAVLRSSQSRLLRLSLGSLELRHSFAAIVGRGAAMRRVLEMLDRVVEMDANVLVLGETGTGKELIARALHEQGPRASGPFVAVNCSAIPPSLAESEFFGHLPGAFTGAAQAHRGYFEQASGGTLFLDEVGDLVPALQAKILRAVETGEVWPLGAEAPVRADLRVVSATHRDLQREVTRGRFRGDLFFRLAVIELRLPPLRERSEDIPHLVRRILPDVASPPPTVSPAALDALVLYPWPGNVRELRNELERAAAFCQGGVIRPEHLSPAVRAARPGKRGRGLRSALRAYERTLVADALRAAGGNKAKAARALGLSWVGLHLKMKRLGLVRSPGGAATRRTALRGRAAVSGSAERRGYGTSE